MPSAAAPGPSPPELSLRLRQQGLVAEFGRFALQAGSFQAILDQASAVAAEGLETGFAKVLEHLPGDMAFLVRAGVGWKEGVVGHARLGGDLQSPAGYAFRTGKPVVSNHLAGERRFRTPKLLAEHGIHSAINVLVGGDGERFGVLEGDSTHRSQFGEHDVAFLQALASTLAVAVAAQRRLDARELLLREAEARLRDNEASLREKDLLMREVHHRVMNSLHLVQTILGMQARTLADAAAREQVEEAAGRILTIGAMHRRLCEGGSVTATDAREYLQKLLGDMRELLPGSAGERALGLEMASFPLPADDIASLGLITGELVTNALKYGRGKVQVQVRQRAGGLELSVSDEGPGFPAGFDPAERRGLGMRLVATLAKGPAAGAVRVDRSVAFGRIVVTTGFGGSG